MTATPIHLMTGPSTVRCGAKMGHWRDNPTGWDLGTVTVEPGKVTCGPCKGEPQVDHYSAAVQAWDDAYADRNGLPRMEWDAMRGAAR